MKMKRVTGNGYRVMGNGEWGTDCRKRVTGFLRGPYPPPLLQRRTGVSHIPNSENGMALIIIVAIVAILSAIGITFMYNMRMEEKAAFNYMNSLKASYIAKSGIEHAIAVLKEDGGDTGYDAYSDRWGYDTDLDAWDGIFNAYLDNDDDSINNDSFLGYFSLSTTVSPNCSPGGCTEGRDSRWIYVYDDAGNIVGRYAVLILDESSRININTAGNRQNQGWGPFEVSFVNFLNACGFSIFDINNAWDIEPTGPYLKRGLTQYRYGCLSYDFDNVPGTFGDDNADSVILATDGIDNDGDGITDNWVSLNNGGQWNFSTDDLNDDGEPTWGEPNVNMQYYEPVEGVDDPYEFISWNPYYSGSTNFDTPLITTEEIKHVYGIGTGTANFDAIKPYITVYSSDENTNDSGLLRLNINLVKDAMALYTVMYDAWEGLIPNYYTYDQVRRMASQVAVNTIDYADRDNVSTFLELSDALGNETTIARGVEAIRINEIMVKPAYQWEAEELFANQDQLEPFALTPTGWHSDTNDTDIYSKTPEDTPGASVSAVMEIKRKGFYRVRVLLHDDGDTIIVGDSSNPDYEVPTDSSFEVSIDDEMSNNIFRRFAGERCVKGWLLDDLGVVEIEEPGDYTLTLTTSDSIDEAGKATEDANSDDLTDNTKDWDDDQWIGGIIVVEDQVREIVDNDDDRIVIASAWDDNPGTDSPYQIFLKEARLDYIQLSQQPDCEYVELVNISDKDIDISEWTLTTSGGWVGRIPNGTVIEKASSEKNYLVLVVDKDDSMWLMFDQEDDPAVPTKMEDEIFFENTWPEVDFDRVVQLELSTAPVNIAENAFGDTVALVGSIFEDSPLIILPDEWEDSGTATFGTTTNYTLTDGIKNWDDDQWKGATITATITADVWIAGVPTSLPAQQITRQISENDTNVVTITTKWIWYDDAAIIDVSATDYHIFFAPPAVTLWKGQLDEQKIVAQVDYLAGDIQDTPCYTQSVDGTNVYGFVALEKNDPTAIYDMDEDGIDDSWLLNIGEEGFSIEGIPMPGGTPGEENSVYDKDPNVDIEVRNLPFATIGDIKEVSVSGEIGISGITDEWSRLGYDSVNNDYILDIKMLADKITVSEKRLEAEEAYYNLTNWGYNDPNAPDGIFLTPYYSVVADDQSDTWWWGLKDKVYPYTGFYSLYLKGEIEDDSGLVRVNVTTGAEVIEDVPLTFAPDGTVYFGQVEIGGAIPSAPAPDQDLLAVCVTKKGGSPLACFDAVILTPENRTYGRININTAPAEVLYALGLNGQQVVNIIDHRDEDSTETIRVLGGSVYTGVETGIADTSFKTIGEILDVEDGSGNKIIDLDEFSRISNLITTKSKIFTIISTGQALRVSDNGTVFAPDSQYYEILGEKKYMVIMER